eukprot:755142-Hanusia_phi.AAC.8
MLCCHGSKVSCQHPCSCPRCDGNLQPPPNHLSSSPPRPRLPHPNHFLLPLGQQQGLTGPASPGLEDEEEQDPVPAEGAGGDQPQIVHLPLRPLQLTNETPDAKDRSLRVGDVTLDLQRHIVYLDPRALRLLLPRHSLPDARYHPGDLLPSAEHERHRLLRPRPLRLLPHLPISMTHRDSPEEPDLLPRHHSRPLLEAKPRNVELQLRHHLVLRPQEPIVQTSLHASLAVMENVQMSAQHVPNQPH